LGLLGQFRELLAAIVQRSLHKQGAHFVDLVAQLFAALTALMPWVFIVNLLPKPQINMCGTRMLTATSLHRWKCR
jgi:hypothetical protein